MMIKILSKVNTRMTGAFCAVLVFCSVIFYSPEALAQAYPTKPVRIIVTSSAGAGGDIVARLAGGKLSETLGQQFIIDNRPGAGGRIAAEIAARSTPDGYTLMMMTATMPIVNAMYKDLKFNIVKDFVPICLLGTTPFVLVVHPSIPANSVRELVALAKSRPGAKALKYGSGGSGSTFHLAAEMFRSMTGIEILHVAYKGGTPPLTNTMSGEVDISFQPTAPSLPMIKSGKLKALGVTSSKRTPIIPGLASVAETVPGYEFIGWYGLVAPAKTPPAILSKLNAELVKIMHNSAVREQMTVLGIDTLGTSQKEFASFITDQVERMKKAVEVSGASPED